ncbi:hypothetical protein EJ06DRAFT_506512 [Trichodelitschia bisporula]|uniref:Phosphatidate cytidylyltransferase n=1 Tax=Trichodelitschia bisporula TaxID=703511 RepID=A0A6G1I4U0_9PEZI|nr:hypothetical protein EJ06DRAFT_506512 [Trichodelitschia bisporula]
MAPSTPVPRTPRVISPSPSDTPSRDGYFPPVTRSAARRQYTASRIIEDTDTSGSDREARARPRSRSPLEVRKAERKAVQGASEAQSANGAASNGTASSSGHLELPLPNARAISRSPSPLGLIPCHTQFRSFIHRHEVPRKALHVSVGFFTTYLYATGVPTSSIHPVLLAALIPVVTADLLRFNYPPFNAFYTRVLGALMRETEVKDRYNGVIWYILGAFLVLRFCPKDVSVVSVLLLSWCDTAASTFGRLWGRYTPRVGKGKSLAGTLAAMVVGMGAAAVFWGWVAPTWGAPGGFDVGEQAFAFQGQLTLPEVVRGLLGWSREESTVGGGLALGIVSVWAGVVAAASEAVDLWGLDDNLTIPVLCGAGLWGFFKVFG